MAGKNYTVRIDGHEVPEGPSETGDFGLSKGELKHIILSQVLNRRDEPMTQRGLFTRVCAHMQIESTAEKEERLLKVFMQLLRELRDDGRVKFRSGDTATYVELP